MHLLEGCKPRVSGKRRNVNLWSRSGTQVPLIHVHYMRTLGRHFLAMEVGEDRAAGPSHNVRIWRSQEHKRVLNASDVLRRKKKKQRSKSTVEAKKEGNKKGFTSQLVIRLTLHFSTVL